MGGTEQSSDEQAGPRGGRRDRQKMNVTAKHFTSDSFSTTLYCKSQSSHFTQGETEAVRDYAT
jgi:hypothetical protein